MELKIRNLSKHFGQTEALRNIDLDVKDGEFLSLLGPSGCGKTTLLRLIAGFDHPTTGEIQFSGELVSSTTYLLPPERRKIGMVFQSFALWPHMKVYEHVAFPLLQQNRQRKLSKQLSRQVEETLSIVGLSTFADRYPNQLSGGQRQRVALARAIATRPTLLLMDEPFSSLDTELRIELRKELQNLHKLTHSTIVFVTHDQSEALGMADRIVVMKEGKIEQIGTPLEIYTQPHSKFVASFVGRANFVKGVWTRDGFIPEKSYIKEIWNHNVSPTFKNEGVFPVRPEQFHISKEEAGIPGVIRNVQFQGREIHYTVEVSGELWEVFTSTSEMFMIGEKIFLRYIPQVKQIEEL
ncbi:MAG: iron(III) transport system ATP-binding protein [Petrotoga sp.]|jgi:iron(III) transport system ATP-binding protein|nr:iron(III) transport system ATP-binding protein [Petrotoga sp.]